MLCVNAILPKISKRYPFNMEFFKYFSQYFQTHSHLYINTIEIDFFDLEYKISLNANAINDFINFCYAKKLQLKKKMHYQSIYLPKSLLFHHLLKTHKILFLLTRKILLLSY